ncbi:uncharacterized protein LOC119355956 [Triticum dicoccoides]|uniref:uncharacterized protein LOC119355956 n=1 Tax=Triticum dicoccoides TaxID=85692 RepID=UPI000E7A2800|nr:uncharacterized protein LOC119355956 [Triticum dicoccoides]
MATAIRHAARILQRSQAAERRLFQTKLPRRLTGDEKKVAAAQLAEIQVKKEELYDKIAGWEARYTLHGSSGLKNVQLLRHLSVQVEPRHSDPRWRSYRRWAYIHDCLKVAGCLFIGKTAGDSLISLYQEKHQGK